MFSNPIPFTTTLFGISYTHYAESHFLKSFRKAYKGRQWEFTEKSIFQELSRLRMPNNTIQQTNQIDQLKHKGEYWLAKYDFKIATTNISAKASGNRCVVFIDNKMNKVEILLIYGKTDLPKNKVETAFIYQIIQEQYPNYWLLLN